MAQRTTLQLGPFKGVITSLDAGMIDDNAASDMRNCNVEDGKLKPRRGFRILAAMAVGTTFNDSYLLSYAEGYVSDGSGGYNSKQEYISIEKCTTGGVTTVKPFSRHVSTGARTEIKNGTTSLALSQRVANMFVFQSIAYVITPGDTLPLYKHTLGSLTSYTQVAVPAEPTVALTYQKKLGGPYDPFGTVSFAGLTVGDDNTKEIYASYSGPPSGIFSLNHSLFPDTGISQGNVAFHVALGAPGNIGQLKINLKATNGNQPYDWRYNDSISFTLKSYSPNGPCLDADPQSMSIYLINNDGSPITIYPDEIVVTGQTKASQGTDLKVLARFKNKKIEDWDNIAYLVVSFAQKGIWTDSALAPGNVTMSKLTIGASINQAPPKAGAGLVFGYSYYNKTGGFESGIAGQVTVPYDVLVELNGLGSWLRLAWAASADAAVEFVRLYVQVVDYSNNTKKWRLANGADGTAIGTLYFDYKLTYEQAMALPEKSSGGHFPTRNLVCGCAFKGWAVWGYSGGIKNIRHSEIGFPETLYDNADSLVLDPDFEGKPADFHLADALNDDPVAMFPCGDALIILGGRGAYEQLGGSRPETMSPPKRIPNSYGCAGAQACCAWHDDAGNPAVAFLSKFGEGVYLVVEDRNSLSDAKHRVVELTRPIRGLIKSYLRDQGYGWTDYSRLRLGVDEELDALFVIMGHRALVLRRPFITDDQRGWEMYDWNLWTSDVHIGPAPTVLNIAFSTNWRMRWMDSNGRFAENEWNSSSSAWIEGANKDGDQPPSEIYWKSKKFGGLNRRIDLVRMERDSLSDRPNIRDYCTRRAQMTALDDITYPNLFETRQMASGHYKTRFSYLCQGNEHQFWFGLQDGQSAITRVLVDEIVPEGKRPNE